MRNKTSITILALLISIAISAQAPQALNYQAVARNASGAVLQNQHVGIRFSIQSAQVTAIKNLAVQCPYVAGDAVYLARSLYAQIDNTIFFNDLLICQPSGSELRMLTVAPPSNDTVTTTTTPKEFVYLYPNPARQIVNLSYSVPASGQVEFDLIDQLGEPVIKSLLTGGQGFVQYSVASLSDGIYYWRLKDSQRTIQTGKVAIVK